MDKNFQQILDKIYSRAHSTSNTTITEETYILAIESVFNMVVITDKDGIVQYANPAVKRITGFDREEVIGKNVQLWGGMMKDAFYKDLWKTILQGKIFKGEIFNHKKNGDDYVARVTISPIIKRKKVIGFVGTEEDITLEKKLQKEKEEFIALASHQLRTPLGAMKWNLELLTANYPKMEKDLTSLAVQNEYMIDLVNRLLVVLQMGENKVSINKVDTDMNEFLKLIVSHFQLKLHNSGTTLEITDLQKKLIINTDPVIIKEIISNLLDNAIKYSKKKGNIVLRISKEKSHWSLNVKDTGIGIPPKEIPHIINKFYRGSNTMSIPGTGLGMYIVSKFVDKLRGVMKINSMINKGTVVTCTFSL